MPHSIRPKQDLDLAFLTAAIADFKPLEDAYFDALASFGDRAHQVPDHPDLKGPRDALNGRLEALVKPLANATHNSSDSIHLVSKPLHNKDPLFGPGGQRPSEWLGKVHQSRATACPHPNKLGANFKSSCTNWIASARTTP